MGASSSRNSERQPNPPRPARRSLPSPTTPPPPQRSELTARAVDRGPRQNAPNGRVSFDRNANGLIDERRSSLRQWSSPDASRIIFDFGVYHGETTNDQRTRHGRGALSFSNGDRYVGMWANDSMHGRGMFTWRDGRKYVGSFKHDDIEGEGKYTFPDGTYYEGSFVADHMLGVGVFCNAQGRRIPLDLPTPVDPQMIRTVAQDPTLFTGGASDPSADLQSLPQRLQQAPVPDSFRFVVVLNRDGDNETEPPSAARLQDDDDDDEEFQSEAPDVPSVDHRAVGADGRTQGFDWTATAPTGALFGGARIPAPLPTRRDSPPTLGAAQRQETAGPLPGAIVDRQPSVPTTPVPSTDAGAGGRSEPRLGSAGKQATLCPEGEEPCVVCMQYRRSYACVPCGHMCLCRLCAKDGRLNECPLCRKHFSMTMKIFA